MLLANRLNELVPPYFYNPPGFCESAMMVYRNPLSD